MMVKREREGSPERLFVRQDNETSSTLVTRTTLSSGPYAGLHSARKRARQHVEPERELEATFGPVENDESDDQKKASKAGFGPAKKVSRKGGAVWTNV